MARKKRKQKSPGQVIIPVGHPNPPESHELGVAMVLADHYQTSVEFLVPIDDYKRKTADIVMLGVEWEIKCPTGKSKYTIQEQFRRASKQALNIIIDTRRTTLDDKFIEKMVIFERKKRPYLKRIVVIDKSENVIEVNN